MERERCKAKSLTEAIKKGWAGEEATSPWPLIKGGAPARKERKALLHFGSIISYKEGP